MKYTIIDFTRSECKIGLTPETEVEKKLIEEAKKNPQPYQETFAYHYQAALQLRLNTNAQCLKVLDDAGYPTEVTVEYAIANGMG